MHLNIATSLAQLALRDNNPVVIELLASPGLEVNPKVTPPTPAATPP